MTSLQPVRLGTWAVALAVGAVYGVAGTLSQGFQPGGVPVGLVVALIGSAALVAAVRLMTEDRWAALAVGLGLMTATLVFSGEGPGGSVVVPQVADGWFNPGVVWTIAVPLIVAVAVAWPEPIRAVAASTDRGHVSET